MAVHHSSTLAIAVFLLSAWLLACVERVQPVISFLQDLSTGVKLALERAINVQTARQTDQQNALPLLHKRAQGNNILNMY